MIFLFFNCSYEESIGFQVQQIVIVRIHGYGYRVYAGTEMHGDLWVWGVEFRDVSSEEHGNVVTG